MTPFQVFLHPRRAAGRIARCEAELRELGGLREKLHREVELEKAAMQGALSSSEQERSRLAARVAELELRVRQEAARGDEQELELQAIGKRVGRVNEVIEKYKLRLSAMHRRLNDARLELREAYARLDSDILPMAARPGATAPPPGQQEMPPAEPEEEEADWYVTPPEL